MWCVANLYFRMLGSNAFSSFDAEEVKTGHEPLRDVGSVGTQRVCDSNCGASTACCTFGLRGSCLRRRRRFLPVTLPPPAPESPP